MGRAGCSTAPMRGLSLCALLSLSLCGPSKEAVDAERNALSAAVDQAQAYLRGIHACDAEREAWTRSITEGTQAIMRGREEAHLAGLAEDRADAKRKMCESLQPSTEELAKKAQAGWDAWVDACLDCSTGRACVDAERKRRTIWGPKKSVADQIASLEEFRKSPACAKR